MGKITKFKFTPLLIISIVLVTYGIYFIFSGKGGNLGPPAGMIIIFIGLICLLPYYIFRKLFKTNVKKQSLTELLLVIVIVFVYYRSGENLVLHVQPNYQGYIILVYGAGKKPTPQKKNFLSPDIDIMVPGSGIIFTADAATKNIVIIDSSSGKIKRMQPGYGIPSANDTLICGGRKYPLDVLVMGNLSADWSYEADTLKRNQKKLLACEILGK